MKQFGTLVGTAALVIAVIGGVTGASLALQASEPAQQTPATVDFRPASGEATLADPVTEPAPADEEPAPAVTIYPAPAGAPAPKPASSADTAATRSTDDAPSVPAAKVVKAQADQPAQTSEADVPAPAPAPQNNLEPAGWDPGTSDPPVDPPAPRLAEDQDRRVVPPATDGTAQVQSRP